MKHPNLEFGKQNETNALLAYVTEISDGIVINDELLFEIKCPAH